MGEITIRVFNSNKQERGLTANNEKVALDHQKNSYFVFKSRVNEEFIDKICYETERITPEVTTTRLFFKKHTNYFYREIYISGKYKFKAAILELGPSGYPLEKFVTGLFEYQDFSVGNCQKLNGKTFRMKLK